MLCTRIVSLPWTFIFFCCKLYPCSNLDQLLFFFCGFPVKIKIYLWRFIGILRLLGTLLRLQVLNFLKLLNVDLLIFHNYFDIKEREREKQRKRERQRQSEGSRERNRVRERSIFVLGIPKRALRGCEPIFFLGGGGFLGLFNDFCSKFIYLSPKLREKWHYL